MLQKKQLLGGWKTHDVKFNDLDKIIFVGYLAKRTIDDVVERRAARKGDFLVSRARRKRRLNAPVEEILCT